MIVGIGIDIVAVSDLRSQIEQIEGFLTEVFAEEEISECRERADPYQCFAARFAAKEAFIKAAGCGWTDDVDFQQITIVSDGSSVPRVNIGSRAKEALRNLEPYDVQLSMSHTPAYACAVIVLERWGKRHRLNRLDGSTFCDEVPYVITLPAATLVAQSQSRP